MGPVAATYQTSVGDSVMRSAEGADLNQRHIGWQLVRHTVDTGDIQGFFDTHARQDTGHAGRFVAHRLWAILVTTLFARIVVNSCKFCTRQPYLLQTLPLPAVA